MGMLEISPDYVPPALPDPSPLKYLLMPSGNMGRGSSIPFKGLGDLFGDKMKDVKMLPGALADYYMATAGLESEYAQKVGQYQSALAVAGPQNLAAINKITNDMIPWYRNWKERSAIVEAQVPIQQQNFENWSKISEYDPDWIMARGDGSLMKDDENNPVTIGDYLYVTANRGMGALAEKPFNDIINKYEHPDGTYLMTQWDKTMKAAARNDIQNKSTAITAGSIIRIGNEDYAVIHNQSETTGELRIDENNNTIEIPQNYDQITAAYEMFNMQMVGDTKLSKAYNYARSLYAYGKDYEDTQSGGAAVSEDAYKQEFDQQFMQNSIDMNEIFNRKYSEDIQAVSKMGDGSGSGGKDEGTNIGLALYAGDDRFPWSEDAMAWGGMQDILSKVPAGTGGTVEDIAKNPNENPINAITQGVSLNSDTWQDTPELKEAVLSYNGFKPENLAEFNTTYTDPVKRQKAVQDGLYNYYWKKSFGDKSGVDATQQKNRDFMTDYMKYYYNKELFPVEYSDFEKARKTRSLGESFQKAGEQTLNALLRVVGAGEPPPERQKPDIEMTDKEKDAAYEQLVKEGRTKLTKEEWLAQEPSKVINFEDPMAFVDYVKYTDYMFTAPKVFPIQYTKIPSDLTEGGIKEKLIYQTVTGAATMPGGRQISNVKMIYLDPDLVVKGLPDTKADGTLSTAYSENKILGTVAMTEEAWEQVLKNGGNTVTIGGTVFNLNKKKHREMLGIYKKTISASGDEKISPTTFSRIKNSLLVEDEGDIDLVVVPVVTGGKDLVTAGWNYGTNKSVPAAMNDIRAKAERDEEVAKSFLTDQP